MKKIKWILTGTFVPLATLYAKADDAAALVIPEPSIGLSTTELLVLALLLFAVVLLLASVTLFNAFKIMYREKDHPSPAQSPRTSEPLDYEAWLQKKKSNTGIWTKLLSLKPIEQEKDMVIPHAYDGIHELNNPVPTWFNVLFYGTLIFAAGYMYYYHIGEHGERQDDEYLTEMNKAELEKKAYLAKFAVSVDENSVKIDPSQIVVGKSIYDANCTACHGEHGEGLVGPNLTDEYWLHGGSVSDIFKVIKYGVPEKGMVSWEKNMSSSNISAVTNYILSLKDTKPANAKAPQGELYTMGVDTLSKQ